MGLSEEEKRKKVEQCCLMSDAIMTVAFNGNNKLAEHVLQILLERDDIHVVSVRTQEWLSTMTADSHAAKLDIHAVDTNGVHYDIEMQKADEKDLINRGVYYSEYLQVVNHKSGDDYEVLPKVMTLFLVEDCKLPEKILCKRYKTSDMDTGDFVDSAPEVRFYNMKYKGEKTGHMGLFFDLSSHEVKEIGDDIFREIMVQYRQVNGMEVSEGMNKIYNFMDDMADKCKEEGIKIGEEKGIRIGEEKGIKIGEEKGRKEGLEEGVKAGKEEGLKLGKEEGMKIGEEKANEECCLSLLKEGTFPEEKIALLLKMSLERVQELKRTIQA